MTVQWDASYDLDGEDVTYSFQLATDYLFQNVLASAENLRLPEATFNKLEPDTYYMRVRATNESGYTQDCYDYYSSDLGKVYGAKPFIVNADGTISEMEVEDV